MSAGNPAMVSPSEQASDVETSAPFLSESALRVEARTRSVSEPAARLETPPPLPMHLSTICNSLDAAREFYGKLLGCEERRATATSVHFDFFGSQLVLHEIKGHNATNFHREVDAEDVPVPHFGAALDEETFHNVAERLQKAEWKFVLNPHKRFLRKGWEQWVLFILDPSGNAVELKSFTKIPKGTWA